MSDRQAVVIAWGACAVWLAIMGYLIGRTNGERDAHDRDYEEAWNLGYDAGLAIGRDPA